MSDKDKLEAIKVYLEHPISTDEEMSEVINKIWYVVHEDRIIDFEI